MFPLSYKVDVAVQRKEMILVIRPAMPDAAASLTQRLGPAIMFPVMITSVFIGTSVDGFIARPDGDLDFLPVNGGEPHGYTEFFASIDALVIGRKTYETVLAFPEWPYGDKRVIVLSTRPLDFSSLRASKIGQPNIEQMSGSPPEIVAKLEGRGIRHAYIDGGITVQQFLRARLIQRLIITRVPVLIGQGIPLFSTLPDDIHLKHVATQSYSSGLVKTEYEVLRPLHG